MKKLLLGISSGIFYTLLSILISLFTVPVYLKFLSKEEFGIFFLINNLIIWIGLLNVGLRGSFKLQLASAIGKGEKTERLITTFLFSQVFVALAVSCVGMGLSFFIYDLLKQPSIPSKNFQLIFFLLSFSFACSLLSNAFAAILSVYNKDFDVYKGRCLVIVFQTVMAIGLLYANQGIIGLAIAVVLAELVFLLYAFYLVNLKFKFAQLQFSYFDREALRQSFSIGKWFLAGYLAQLLIRHTDLFLISKFTTIDEVTRYIISSKLYWLASTFLLVIIKVVSPQLIRLKHTTRNSYGPHFYEILFIGSFSFITVLLAIFIGFINEWFIHWWIGGIYYLGNQVNVMLMLIFAFSSFNIGIRTLLLAKNQLKAQKISALAEGILHLSFTIVLGIYYGLNGVIIGIAMASILACFISFGLNYRRFSHVIKDN